MHEYQPGPPGALPKNMNKPMQSRKVHVLGTDYTVRNLFPGEWVLCTAVGMVCFRRFGKHWTPYARVAGGERELHQWSTTRLDTTVRRVMLRARAAYALADALGTFRRAQRECLYCNDVLPDEQDDECCDQCSREHTMRYQSDLGGES